MKNRRAFWYTALATTALMAVVDTAMAAPEGGVVSAGSATIDQSGNQTTIQQSSNRAVIDWQKFNLQNGEQVRFVQPGRHSVTLNRIHDANPSLIDGNITANGSIYLLNQNGVIFGNNARIDVGSLIATTANISDANFMAGVDAFTTAGNLNARIENHGHITAAEAGLVGLVAPQVENSGLIEAHLGRVHLASGETFTVDLAGDGLLNVAVSDADMQQRILNSGAISVDGGSILLTAAAGREVVDSLITHSGTLQANTLDTSGGRIVLRAEGEASKIDVSGTLTSNADQTGNGGEIIILADGNTRFTGHAEAKGGAESGDGGFIEVSGKNYLDMRGTVDLSAPNGETGDLLLDPGDIVVCQFGASADPNCNPAGVPALGGNPFDSGANALSYVNIGDAATVGTLLNLLQSANVGIATNAAGAASGNITITDEINTGGVNQVLTFSAHNDIIVDAPISARRLTFNAGGEILLNANLNELGSGIVNFQPLTVAGTMGVAGGAGTTQLSTASLAFLQPGWNTVNIGRSDGSGELQIGAYDWTGNAMVLRTRFGLLNILGEQTFTLNATINSRNLHIGGALTGTGTLTIQTDNAATVGVGDGAVGSLNISGAELDFIGDDWAQLDIGLISNSQPMDIQAYNNWRWNTAFRSNLGTISLTGDMDMGSHNLAFSGTDFDFNGDISGTGIISLGGTTDSFSMGVAGAAGDLSLSAADLDRIQDGWSLIEVGRPSGDAGLTVDAYTWRDPVLFQNNNGDIVVNGAQDFGANDATFSNGGNIILNAALSGTGALRFQADVGGRTVGIAGGAGVMQVSAASLDNIQSGFSELIIGRDAAGTAVVDIGAYSGWNTDVRFITTSGAITFSGAQDFGAHDLTLQTSQNPVISAPLTGAGTFWLYPYGISNNMGLGGGVGTISLDDTELDNLQSNWQELRFGRLDMTNQIAVGDYANWQSPVRFMTDTGVINFTGDQNFNTNDVILQTDGDVAIGAVLSGSGTLQFLPNDDATAINLGGAPFGMRFLDAELSRIDSTWQQVVFGRSDANGLITVDAFADWKAPTVFRSSGGIVVNGAQGAGHVNAEFTFDDAVSLGGDVTTLGGDITFADAVTLTANSIITSGGGDVNFDAAVDGAFDFAVNAGSGDAIFDTLGSTVMLNSFDVVSGTLEIPTSLTVADDLSINSDWVLTANQILTSNTGNITLDGNIDGSFSLLANAPNGAVSVPSTLGGTTPLTTVTLQADSLNVGGNITTSGDTVLAMETVGQTIGLNAAGAFSLNAATLANINAARIMVGDDAAGNATVGALVLSSPLWLETAGTVTVTNVLQNTAAGNAVVLVGTQFHNLHGAGALLTANGRSLVYSTNPALDTKGGLNFQNLYNSTFDANPPATIAGLQSAFIYSSGQPAPQVTEFALPKVVESRIVRMMQVVQNNVSTPVVEDRAPVAEDATPAAKEDARAEYCPAGNEACQN